MNKKVVAGKMPQYSERLTDDAWPRSMPDELHRDLRGKWLLEHYGPPGISDAIQEVLDYEAREGGMAIGPDFLGFIEDYYRIAQYATTFDLRTIIVDVGCCAGLQQVFFRQFAGYIGIDQRLHGCVRPLQPNARFIEGKFGELVKSGAFVIDSTMFGIANRSLLYQSGNEASILAFKKFTRLLMG